MPYLWLAFTPKSVLWFATGRGHVFNDPEEAIIYLLELEQKTLP